MRIDIISLFPDMVRLVGQYGIVGRAVEQQLLTLVCWQLRDFSTHKHHNVDDRPYGGGAGMVIMAEPVCRAIAAVREACDLGGKVVYLSPQGRRLDQVAVNTLAAEPHLVLLAGRYEGIDERAIDLEVDEEWSIGDYVLSGGELPCMVLVDAIARLLPGAVGTQASTEQDSFMAGLLDYPHYTRPEQVAGKGVPDVLLGGDHQAIAQWRRQQALGRTWLRRPDLLMCMTLTDEDQALLDAFISEQAAL